MLSTIPIEMDLSLAASDEPEIPPAMQVIQVPVLEFSADKPKKTLDQQPSTTREGASIVVQEH